MVNGTMSIGTIPFQVRFMGLNSCYDIYRKRANGLLKLKEEFTMDDGLFGGLFDLNNDRVTDVGEAAFGMAMLDEIDADSDREEALNQLQEKLADLELEEPEDACSDAYDKWEECRDALEEKIAELEG